MVVDLDKLAHTAGVGRSELEGRVATLVEYARDLQRRPPPTSEEARSFKEMCDTLTRCQERCKQLITENRRLRGIPDESDGSGELIVPASDDPTTPPFHGSQA